LLETLKTTFLPNFPRSLFGSAKTTVSDALAAQRSAIECKSLLELDTLLGRFLP